MKAGVIGCGRMGAFTSKEVIEHAPICWLPLSHAESFISHPVIVLDSLCDSHLPSLKKAGKQFSINNLYTDHLEMISKNQLEFISIATRTLERSDIILSSLNYKIKAMHIEKPLCNSVKQLKQIEKGINKKNIALTYGAIRRHFNIYQKAKEMLDSGNFGDLLDINVGFGNSPIYTCRIY